MSHQQPAFHIGPIPIFGRLVLAPMDGFCDVPFRLLARQFGSALSYTPFAHAAEIVNGVPAASRQLDFHPDERPIVFQLYDHDVERLVQAALRVQQLGPDVIDINMGCSARGISGRGAGAGLLRDPLKVGRLVHRLSSALEVPVTAKIRLGWDRNSRNFLQVSRAIEENGGAAIAVHARTRKQAFRGKADWDAIAALKSAVSIPVIGNGDVRSPADASRLLALSGCEAVMIGRAAQGNPWIFQYKDRGSLPRSEIIAVIQDHLRASLSYHGEPHGLQLFRKHLVRYLAPLKVPFALRQKLLTSTDLSAVWSTLDSLVAESWRVPESTPS